MPGLRTIAVTGPRIDPASLPQVEGLESEPSYRAIDPGGAARAAGLIAQLF